VWITVVLLAFAVNVEPTRFILLPFLLARNRPLVQLLAYLIGCVSVNLVFGFLILFVFHQNPLGDSASGGGRAQIAVGALALAIAVVMAVRWRLSRGGDDSAAEAKPSRSLERFTNSVRKLLGRGQSPVFAGFLGVSIGVPSVDYLAVLLIIGTSGKPPTEQAAALVTFVLLGSIVVIAPLIGYLFSPKGTLEKLDRFAVWTRTRSQVEYAGLLALIGCLLIGLGVAHL